MTHGNGGSIARKVITQRPTFSARDVERLAGEFGCPPGELEFMIADWLRGSGTPDGNRQALRVLEHIYRSAEREGSRAGWRGVEILGGLGVALIAVIIVLMGVVL